MAKALEGLQGFQRIVDGVLVYDANISDHTQHIWQFLQHWANHGISLNPSKFHFGEESVKFGGFQLSADSYIIAPDLTSGISEFPTPATLTDLWSFFGLVNQLGSFTLEIACLV